MSGSFSLFNLGKSISSSTFQSSRNDRGISILLLLLIPVVEPAVIVILLIGLARQTAFCLGLTHHESLLSLLLFPFSLHAGIVEPLPVPLVSSLLRLRRVHQLE